MSDVGEITVLRVSDSLMELRALAERNKYLKPYRVLLTRTQWLRFLEEQGPVLPVQRMLPRIQWNDLEFEVVDDR